VTDKEGCLQFHAMNKTYEFKPNNMHVNIDCNSQYKSITLTKSVLITR